MNKILSARTLAENVKEFVIDSPAVARNARAGQFVIVIVHEGGERVPFTICDYDRAAGTVTLLVQLVGYSTKLMGKLSAGDSIYAIVGPLGKPTEIEHANHPVLIGGGIGTAVIYPQAKYLRSLGKNTDVIVGARNKSLIFYEEEFRKIGCNLYLTTDDGSYVQKGFVTDVLRKRLAEDKSIDLAFAVGPMPMMRACANVAKEFSLSIMVSMNSIMVDGTGMCGGCRLTVGGKLKYACVDGPEFDGHEVDWDESLKRLRIYGETEKEHLCRLKDN